MTRPIPPLSAIDRLLIVKTSSIGDVVHALPVVEAIKKAKPGLTLGWAVRRRCADVLRGNPVIDHLHVFENKPGWGELIRLRAELRAVRYEVALDMQGLFLSGLITRLSGAPVRIGIDRNREGNALFLTHPVVRGKVGGDAGDRHAVDILYGFAEALGIGDPHPEFSPQPYLAAEGVGQAAPDIAGMAPPRIALNVGASWEYKRWPVEHWTALADALVEAGRGVVFVGDKNDAVMVAEVKARLKRGGEGTADLSGRTNLRQLAAALAECAVVVSADTGPLHLAVAVGTPVVALFGATNAARTGPYGGRNIVLNMHLSCSPCYRNPTCNGRVDCMKAITPEMALAAVEEKLRG
jgi:heptosyltransferase-1